MSQVWMMGMPWQSAATAPRDGSRFIALFPGWHLDYSTDPETRTPDFDADPVQTYCRYSGWGGGVWECGESGKRNLDEMSHWLPELPLPKV